MHIKKMQECRMHTHNCSHDSSGKKLYTQKKERDEPLVNGLGIPVSPRI